MCTAYGDRHYRTFDGLLYDFISACKVYLVKVKCPFLTSVWMYLALALLLASCDGLIHRALLT